MFFILSKTIPYLLMPLSLIVGLLFFSFLIKNLKWKRRLRILSLVLLIICSNSFLTNQVFKWWEIPPTPMDLQTSSQTVGIVLTGVVKKEKLPHDRVYLAEGADRVTHAIQLYKAGKIQKIIISGGTGSLTQSHIREATQLREVFLMCSVPDEDLIVEDQSRNTRESAVAVSEIIKKNFADSEYLLITSAFHMRRSLACFKKVGVPATGFSTDFKTGDYPPQIMSFIVPEPGALNKWHILVREIMGMAAYKLMGYV